jgi:pyruvate formate lyase activating enzyme
VNFTKNHELILENARKMAEEGVALQIRIPIIPGCNDSEENIRATGAFCAGLGPSVSLVQILPYHRLGSAKYERLGKEYQLAELKPPDQKQMKKCRGILESYGLKVVTGCQFFLSQNSFLFPPWGMIWSTSVAGVSLPSF